MLSSTEASGASACLAPRLTGLASLGVETPCSIPSATALRHRKDVAPGDS